MATTQTTTGGGERSLSLPLYLGGLAVTLCGVLTVTYTVADAGFSATAVLLTLVGFVFSLGCRALGTKARIVEWLCWGMIALTLYGGLTQRIDWSVLMPAGVDKNDQRLAVLLCWAAMLRSWALFSDEAVLFSPVLSIAAIGLVASSDLNPPVAAYFGGCVVATAFLLIHSHALRQRALASPQERASRGPGLAGQVGLAALCGLVVIGLSGLLIVPLEAVSKNLSLAGAIRRLARFSSPANAASLTFRFSDDAMLMVGTGAGWSASPQVVMRVTPDDGQPHYWRGRTYDRYVGDGWVSTLDGQTLRVSLPPTLEDDGSQTFLLPTPPRLERPLLTATFDVLGETDGFYYAADPRRLRLYSDFGTEPRLMRDGRLDLGGRSLSQQRYTVMSLTAPDPADPDVQARLRRGGTRYPEDVRRRYLGNLGSSGHALAPGALAYYRKAVAEALRRLPPGRRMPVDKALAIRDWVAARCTYSLAAPPLPEQLDHVYEFLAHTRRGYCDLFASSMAVLCRVAGLPARVATGFAPGEPDGAVFNLRAMDKHAWTEVYFPDEGWLMFDPTAGTRTDGSLPTSQARYHWDWRGFLRGLGPVTLLLALLILTLLLYVAKTEWYDRWRARRAAPARTGTVAASLAPEIGRQYARMAQILGGLGLIRRSVETPDEYAARAEAFLAAQGPGAPSSSVVAALTAHLVAARYAAAPPSPGQVQETERALRAFASAAMRLRWMRVWNTRAIRQ